MGGEGILIQFYFSSREFVIFVTVMQFKKYFCDDERRKKAQETAQRGIKVKLYFCKENVHEEKNRKSG